jgi:hypothetical protein
MYEMEGPRRVPPRTADPVARARALRRDICLVDLASRLPGHRLRRDRRLASLTSRLPGGLVRRGIALLPSPAGCPADSFGVASPRFPRQPVARPTRSAWQSPRRSHQPVARLLRAAWRALRCPGKPIARPPCATSRSCPRNPASPVNAGLLDPPGVPRVSPEADPVFSSERFLRPVERATQALSAITSRFFCHPQDIRCLSPVHPISPPDRAQLFHRFPGITTGRSGLPGAVHCIMPTMWQPRMRGLLGGSGD